MKTVLRIEGIGTEVYEGNCSVKEAMNLAGLVRSEWNVEKSKASSTKTEYVLTRKQEAAKPGNEKIHHLPRPKEEGPHLITSESHVDSVERIEDLPSVFCLHIPRGEFQQALKVACDFTPVKTTLPVLTYALIEFDGTGLSISATDLECSWKKTIPATGNKTRLCIPARLVYSEVKALHNNITIIDLEYKEGEVSINGRCTLATMDPEEFPELPEAGGDTIEITELSDKLRRVAPAMSMDEIRYNLNGTHFDFENGMIVATDGYRLHTEGIEKNGHKCVTLPRRAVNLIVKYPGIKEIVVGEEKISCELAGGQMISKMILDVFPEYIDLLKKHHENTVEFDAKEFFKIIEGAIPLAGESRTVRLTIGENLEIDTSSASIGKYRWQIPCQPNEATSGPASLTFTLQYLTDAIKAYAGDASVHMAFTPQEKTTLPVVINGKSVVMPQRS